MVVYWYFATARANLKVVSEWTVSVYDYECIVLFVHLQHYIFLCFHNPLNSHIHGLQNL